MRSVFQKPKLRLKLAELYGFWFLPGLSDHSRCSPLVPKLLLWGSTREYTCINFKLRNNPHKSPDTSKRRGVARVAFLPGG
eukprot:2103620-Amphidinium_carterae.1